MSRHIGIDLGGTKIEGAVLDGDCRILERRRVPTPAKYEGILRAVGDLARRLEPGGDRTIGVGTPGTAGPDGLIKNSNTRCLRGRPLKADLEEMLGSSIRMANDADCFAAAEARMGAASGYGTVFGAILGTGVGGGVVADGRVRFGRAGISGEWGHSVLHHDGNRCWCGKRGCVETYISGPALERRWRDAAGTGLSVQEIVALRPAGYEGWRDAFLADFGLALSNVIQVLDPDIVVLGGGLSNIPFLYDAGASAVHKMALDGGTPIVRNILGDSAGVVGAALMGAAYDQALDDLLWDSAGVVGAALLGLDGGR